MMRPGLSEPFQKNKSTCWRSELEIKTDDCLFLRKHRDNLQFVYLLSFGVFEVPIGTSTRKPARNLPKENRGVSVIVVLPRLSEVDMLQL